ncbi:hypothetical protein [Mesorhizobium sp. WSM3862]|uniref:hypothetical protein n=1 Tax=Mesorhizobium sp. WSM3862 TaxID=632858 RepID=UPI000BAEC675|nr:hypothetical protein [Mesorhizobium sp. WSM3862]PBB95644.1 hypothetical protein CK224_25660 [Mesorhizobium sp. WSM3862]
MLRSKSPAFVTTGSVANTVFVDDASIVPSRSRRFPRQLVMANNTRVLGLWPQRGRRPARAD